MEKWMRGLSKTTALIIGFGSLFALAIFSVIFLSSFSGLIPLIIFGGILGGGVGFSLPMIMKGITGQTPQEKKEARQIKP